LYPIYMVKAKPTKSLDQIAITVVLLEVVFGTVAYKILVRPYHGELWLRIIFWPAFIISAVAFAANLKMGWALIRRKHSIKNNKVAVILFCFGLLFILMINLLYWSQT